ncbi:unnamed protein product [Rhizophagus irregularis]|nr:unnamed protein product [Rhizophagus irregularis]
MSYDFHSELSNEYLSIFENSKYSDVTIKVGKGNNPKEFKAHSFVLKVRSKFFEKEIKKKENSNSSNNNVTLFIREDFNFEAFEYVLKYLYSGSFNLVSKDINFILDMLVISEFINLIILINVLQKYLVEKRKKELDNYFSIVHKTCSKCQSFEELRTYCDKTAQLYPTTIFKADDFTTLDKDLLIFILENKKNKLYEIQKWDYIIKWGITQNSSPLPEISSSSSSIHNTSLWSKANFRDLSVTLKPIIGLIDFKKISSKDFCNKVKPFKKIFERTYYDELLVSQLGGGN